MGPDSSDRYHKDSKQLECSIPEDLLISISNFQYQKIQENGYSKPMPWIGMYIALASLFCILTMVADLLHGLRNRKLWFPCKYFTINAASLTLIAVAMKLPMDLSDPMPGLVDQVTKLGSMAFMCTMMANLLPSLATMDGKELVTNMIASSVLVITLVVNVCIQIKTGIVSDGYGIGPHTYYTITPYYIKSIAAIYVAILLMLLIIHTCSSLAIQKSKQMIELKYQQVHKTLLMDQHRGRLIVENLKEQVSNYWIMAETGSPQFMTTSSATTAAAGVICGLSTILHIFTMLFTIHPIEIRDYDSDYKWSMLVIFIIQFLGVVLGTIAPVSRCFASLNFKLSTKWSSNHIKVFKVESYWTEKLFDWKQSSIPSPFSSRKCKVIIENLKILILNLCIGFQKTVVVACKMLALILIFLVICVLYCIHGWKWLKGMFSVSGVVLGEKPKQLEQNKDIHRYALQLQEEMEFSERTLKGILNSVNHLIQKAERQQPKNLIKVLAECRGFEGVGKYDSHHVPPLLSEEYLDCWSLPFVTLTTIAISLPNIQKDVVELLLSSVSEGLVYVTFVEEIFSATHDYVSTRKAAKILWLEVEVYHKWLGNKLRKFAPQLNTTEEILHWFNDTAKNIVAEVECENTGMRNVNNICRFISANSMYRITETLLLFYHNTDQVTQEELFVHLSSMIGDILAACLTNLPQVIVMKCHTIEIEKREESVHVAAQLLGETLQIINNLQYHQLPSLNPDELPFIDKWRAYFKDPFP